MSGADNTPPVIRSVPTLRDQFAIAALTGLIGNWEDTGIVAEARLAIAAEAYAIADAMLIVRVR